MKRSTFVLFTLAHLGNLTFLSAGHAPSSTATPISTEGLLNDNLYYLTLSTYPNGYAANCKDACYPTLIPAGQQWIEIWDQTGYIYLDYNVCESINSDGSCNNYLGHVQVTFSVPSVNITSVEMGSATLTSYPNQLYGLSFTPDNPPTPTFPIPTTYTTIPYRGVNLAGGEFASGFQLPSASDALYFVEQGMNIIRIPFLWEYLQGSTPLGTGIDFSSGNPKKLLDLTTQLTDAKIYVIWDMHNYMRYNGGIIGVDPSAPTKENYAVAWQSLAEQCIDNPYVFFDLMNEPYGMATESIISNYNAAIEAIRNIGANNLILLEGNQYTCLAAWGGNNYTRTNAYGTSPCYYGTPNSVLFVAGSDPASSIVDPANNYAINVHEYFSDPNGCGSEGNCINPDTVLDAEMFDPFVSWLQQTKQRAFLSELNGNPNSNCAACINNFLIAVEGAPNQVVDNQNTGGFIGWSGWAGGSAWPEGYDFNLTPYVDGNQRIQMIEGFNPNLVPPPQ